MIALHQRPRRQRSVRGTSLQPTALVLEQRIALSTTVPSDPGGGQDDPNGVIAGSGIGYSFDNWAFQPLTEIEFTNENTFPIIGPRGQGVRAAEDWIIRDPYPVSDLDGNLARVNGWYVIAGLATPRVGDGDEQTPSTLNEVSFIISRDGVHWMEGGTLYSDRDEGIPGDQLFSGDLRYDVENDRLLIYYTSVDGTNTDEYVQGPSGAHMRQLMGVSEARPINTPEGLRFTDFVHHGIKLEPDGQWYAKPEEANTETEVYGFRDPWIFRDPASSEVFMVFTANWGTDQQSGMGSFGDLEYPDAGPHTTDPDLPRNDGVVGIARATDDSLIDWELLPPLFGGIDVNTQLELPHFIFHDGRYYLFAITHDRTFIGDLKYENPGGLYGWVADELQGPYRPLNETSLVLANPASDTLQNYGWKVFPSGEGRATVVSFINRQDSGTVSPVVELAIDGDRVWIDRHQPLRTEGAPVPTVLSFGTAPTAPAGAWPWTISQEVGNEIFVTELYHDLLRRNPAMSEVEGWTTFLANGGTRAEVASQFVESTEYLGLIVEDAYQTYLGRASDPMGHAGWVEFLAGGNSSAELAARFIASEEYSMRRGATVDAFLSSVYNDVLGRDPDGVGQETWSNLLDQGASRLNVARQIVGSDESFRGQVERIYQRFLGRTADEGGINTWLSQLNEDTPRRQVKASILSSPEFASRYGI